MKIYVFSSNNMVSHYDFYASKKPVGFALTGFLFLIFDK